MISGLCYKENLYCWYRDDFVGKTMDSNAWSVESNSVLHHSFTKKENLTSFFLPDFMEENSQKKIYLQDLKWMAKKKKKRKI